MRENFADLHASRWIDLAQAIVSSPAVSALFLVGAFGRRRRASR
jgi:hypothetical protein